MMTRRPQLRRGSAYLLVVGASLMVTIIGLSVVTLAQINGRLTNQSNDATECETLAQSALEYAAVTINNDPLWRTTYQAIFTPAVKSLGRGTITFKITDTSGNGVSLMDNTQPVKIYGIARIGTTCRIFSATYVQSIAPMGLLKTSLHSGAGVTVSSPITTTNGPISSNSTMNIQAAVTGDVQGVAIVNSGSVSGKTTTLTTPLTMPTVAAYNLYYQYGTDIPYSFTGGTIQYCLLSPTSNPYGPANPYGVYRINVPAGQTLYLKNSRFVSTLVVNLGLLSTLNVAGTVLIQPPRQDFPSMIVNASLLSTVTIAGGTGSLSEGGSVPNLNPPGTPYNGVTNATTTDSYPCQLMGLVHVIGSISTVNLGSNLTVVGTLVSDNALSPGSHCVLQADPNLAKFPPMGYTQIGPMTPVAGTYRREQDS